MHGVLSLTLVFFLLLIFFYVLKIVFSSGNGQGRQYYRGGTLNGRLIDDEKTIRNTIFNRKTSFKMPLAEADKLVKEKVLRS
jgi:hypothetical protein